MAYSFKFIKNGNIKVGSSIWTANKLAGNGEINGVKGSCSKYCTGCYNKEDPKKSSCYVFKSYRTYGWKKSTVVKSHISNTLAMRNDPDSAFADIALQLKRAKIKPTSIRIHASGEIESAEELYRWIEVSRAFPSIPFYIYTKAYDYVESVFRAYEIMGKTLPDNFFLNVSVWHENGTDCYKEWKHIPNVRAFVYDDGYDYGDLVIDCHCPAYSKNGKMNHNATCDKCKICFRNKNKVCACYDH